MYLVAAVIVCVGVVLVRRRVVAGPAGLDPAGLTGVEIGYLIGGPKRAVAAVLGGLRIAGAIRSADGRVVQGRPAPATWGRLGPAVRAAVGGFRPTAGLLHRRAVVDALHPVRRDLVDRGWLLSDRTRRRVRLLSAPVWALFVVGVALAVRAAQDDRPFGWYVVTAGAVFYAAIPLTTAPELPASARRALDRFTEASAHLSPAANPSLVTYGPAAAAVAVGLFGTTVLLPVDPDLALVADLMHLEPVTPPTRETAGSGSGGSCGDGDSGCGGCGGCGG